MGKLPCEDWRLQCTGKPRETPQHAFNEQKSIGTALYLEEHVEIRDGLFILALANQADDRRRRDL